MASPTISPGATRQANNVAATKYWGAGILGIILLMTVFHWIGKILQRRRPDRAGPLTKATRLVRTVLIRRVPYLSTVGHGMLFSAYLGINVAVTVTLVKWDSSILVTIAKRLGWVAAVNMAFLTFLALKNTPLAFLTAQSYERLNIFHRLAGYTTIAALAGHVLVYLGALQKSGTLYRFVQFDQIMGIVSGGAMLLMGLTGFLLREKLYEMFYIIHIVCYILALITFAMHRPDPEEDALWIVVFAAALWFSDRLLRAGRIFWYAGGNVATVTLLPHSGMRLVLKRSSHRAVPGSHIYLWIPSIRMFETHPFTVASTNPIELVIKAQDGFTSDLLKKVTARPDVELRASMDGPYGSLPDYSLFDHIVFVAGGSGASFTFGIACGLLQNVSEERRPSMSFHWAIRSPETLTWFATELSMLQSSPFVHTTIHITASNHTSNSPPLMPEMQTPANTFHLPRKAEQQPSLASSNSSRSLDRAFDDIEKQGSTPTFASADSSSVEKKDFDIEKQAEVSISSSSPIQLPSALSPPSFVGDHPRTKTMHRRPATRDMVTAEIECIDRKFRDAGTPNNRVLVVACGPGKMVEDVRRAVVSWVAQGDGCGVELLVEGFGW